MHVYNAIIVLKEILPVFPVADVTSVGPDIQSTIDKLIETETRDDLKIIARAYAAGLKKREPMWAVPKPVIKASQLIFEEDIDLTFSLGQRRPIVIQLSKQPRSREASRKSTSNWTCLSVEPTPRTPGCDDDASRVCTVWPSSSLHQPAPGPCTQTKCSPVREIVHGKHSQTRSGQASAH